MSLIITTQYGNGKRHFIYSFDLTRNVVAIVALHVHGFEISVFYYPRNSYLCFFPRAVPLCYFLV